MKRTIHKMRTWAWLPLLLALTLALLPAAPGLAQPGGPTTIDPFTAAQCAGPVCAPAQPVITDPGILGGERDVLASPGGGTSALRVWGSAGPALSVENGPPEGRSTYLVVWDGPDGDETVIDYDGLGADLLAGCEPGSASLELHQTYLDRSAAYTLTVYSGAANWSTWSSGIVDESEALFQVLLADFAVGGGAGADWHNVGAISLFVDTSLEPTADLSLAALRFDCMPTAVELVRFEAARRGRAVHLEWETASEIDNLGFNLYRQAAEGELVRLNAALIPGQAPGSPVGGLYAFTDDTAGPDAYGYWLEDVNIYGATTLHGPVAVEAIPKLRRGD